MQVEFRVPRNSFAASLGDMREWLDNRKCPPVRFETSDEGAAVRIRIELPNESLAEAFRQTFDPVSSWQPEAQAVA